jgi:Ca-activated chloride channel family protein
MRFLHPELLWLLTLLPFLLILKGNRGKAPSLIFSTTSLARIMAPGRKTSPGRLAMVLKLIAIGLVIIALARPQQGNTTTEINASGIDILLAVDVSGSMEAMDFRLGGRAVNRLEVVKNVVGSFIEARPNDRIGLVAFAGKPYLISPLTLDHDWLQKRLESLSIGMIEDGTAIGSAIGTSVNRLRDQDSKSRIIILLTDGINNGGRIPPLIAAEAAEALKIKVYTIGAGTRGEASYPVVRFGRRQLVRAKVDIDEKTLRGVAEKTGARYFRATDTQSLEKIYSEINTMETTTRSIKKFENYRELFPLILLAAFAFLSVELFFNRSRLP